MGGYIYFRTYVRRNNVRPTFWPIVRVFNSTFDSIVNLFDVIIVRSYNSIALIYYVHNITRCIN